MSLVESLQEKADANLSSRLPRISSQTEIILKLAIPLLVFSTGIFAYGTGQHPHTSLVRPLKQIMENDQIAILVSGLDPRENVVLPALQSLHKYVTTPLWAVSGLVYVSMCDPLTEQAQKNIQERIQVDAFFNYAAEDQVRRLETCLERTLELKGDIFSFFIRVRPDMFWIDMISLPFARDAIMVRSRRIGGARVTSQHVSWSQEHCGCSSGCVVVDDQLAVVPKEMKDAYFYITKRASSPENQISISPGTHNLTDADEGRRFFLSESTVSSCTCIPDWPEGILTKRLASGGVSIRVSPFSVMLAPPKLGRSEFRAAGVDFRRDDDWRVC